jgi:hypothetical protein
LRVLGDPVRITYRMVGRNTQAVPCPTANALTGSTLHRACSPARCTTTDCRYLWMTSSPPSPRTTRGRVRGRHSHAAVSTRHVEAASRMTAYRSGSGIASPPTQCLHAPGCALPGARTGLSDAALYTAEPPRQHMSTTEGGSTGTAGPARCLDADTYGLRHACGMQAHPPCTCAPCTPGPLTSGTVCLYRATCGASPAPLPLPCRHPVPCADKPRALHPPPPT